MAANRPAVPTRLYHLAVGRFDGVRLDPRTIKVEAGHNPRDFSLVENDESLAELMASIKAEGVLVPLLVRYDNGTKEAILVDGERRLRSVLRLIAQGVPIESVPVVQVPAKDEAERLLLALVANASKPLSQWEEGKSYLKFVRFGWTVEKIAERTGKSVRYVKDAMELADSPVEVRRLLSEDKITPALALKSLRERGSSAGAALAAQVAAAAPGQKLKRTQVPVAPKGKGPKASSGEVAANVKLQIMTKALKRIAQHGDNEDAVAIAEAALEEAGVMFHANF